jgi:amino acid adenylation domain-containing protein
MVIWTSGNLGHVNDDAQTVDQFMLATERLAPDAPAVLEMASDGGFRTLTYRQLGDLARDYARTLGDLRLAVGDRVMLESHTSGPAIAMLLACSMRGLAFVPVSPETPEKRLLSIIDSAEPALHVQAATGRRSEIPVPVGTGRFGMDGLTVDRVPAPRAAHREHVVGTDPAYIIYTSGTTGRPKGVVMSHRGVLAFYRGMLTKRIVGPGDRLVTTSPLQFDFALLDIGLGLGSGATLVPVSRDVLNWPRRFLGFLADVGATQVDGVPTIWRSALRHEAEQLSGLTGIRGVLFSGENFPLPELRQLRSLLPGLRVVNAFGPTESMAFSLTDVPDPIPADLAKLSIGQAYPGAEMAIFDEAGQVITQPGVTGEIYMRGPSLFSGYWDDPAATRAALIPDPLNPRSGQTVFRSGDLAYRDEKGDFYFCGRVDLQVKIRGNRVELGEVERRMLDFPGISAVAALVLPRPDQDPVLAAFVVMADQDYALDELELSAFCMETLPDYMVPHELRVVNELPVTPNGKVDRRALTDWLACAGCERLDGCSGVLGGSAFAAADLARHTGTSRPASTAARPHQCIRRPNLRKAEILRVIRHPGIPQPAQRPL